MTTSTSPIGVHALVWAGGTTPTEVETAVGATAAAGYDILELSLHDLDRLDVEDARARFDAAGIQVTCSRGLAFDADVSSDDPAVVARGQDLLHASLEAADGLGATVLTGALYSALGKYDHRLTDAGRDHAVGVLSELAQEAAGRGMEIGLEVCNRYETNVVNTARAAMQLADDIDQDNVFVHLDTYHMNIEESDVATPVREVGERLGYVHIGENHRGYLGSGSIDFPAFFQALARIDYRGPLTFESFSSRVVSPTLSIDLAVWRDMWSDGADLATQARTFIDAHLRAAATLTP